MIRIRLTLVVAIVLAFCPFSGFAGISQAGDIVWEELAEDADISVSRGFELDEDAADPFRSDLVGLYALGIVHPTEADARATFSVSPNYLIASFEAAAAEDGYTFEEPETVEIDEIGERHEALSVTATVEGGFVSLTMGVVTVRQGTWVQMLYGFGFNDEVVDHLAEIAADLEARWPNGDPIVVDDDDIHANGPWAMAPAPEDVASDLIWIEAIEEGPDSAADLGVDSETGASPGDEGAREIKLPVDRRGTEAEPGGTPESNDAVVAATPEPGDTGAGSNEDGPGVIVPAGTTDEASDVAADDDAPSRLVTREPGPLTLWMILPEQRFTIAADDGCVGAGGYEALRPGGVVSLLDEGAGATHIESVMIEAAGTVYFDTVLQEDVCTFRLEFTSVAPGSRVLVDLDRVVLGRFDHVAPITESGEPAVYEIVVGE